MAYYFRPTRPKAGNPKRLIKRESVFQVERGPISVQKRDMKQLDDFRSRSFLQRRCNTFKTASERCDLTVGEQEIKKHWSKATNSSCNQINHQHYSIQTLPSEEKDRLAAKFTPGCFEYVQNYHHYVLDLNKLEKGQTVPYLSSMEKQNSSDQSKITSSGKTRKEENTRCSKSGPSYFSGMPRRVAKSASRSRRSSAGATAKTDSNFIINALSNAHSPREYKEGSKGMRSENLNWVDNSTLQDLIILEIEDDLEENRATAKESTSEMPHSHINSIYQVPNPSSIGLRAPSGTPVDTPRSPSAHNSFPSLPNNLSNDVTKKTTLHEVNPEIRKPYLAAFTTRIPPIKAPEISLTEERRKRKQYDCIPDYQRYRILCDAFRPITPPGGRTRRQIDRHRPNFVTSEELDYYIDVVNSINSYSWMV